jgi:chaperonin GroEL
VDALNSAKSAMQHGVLPGGGVALFQAAKLLEDGLPSLTDDHSERVAVKILSEALKEPLKHVIMNKTGQDPSPVIDKI